MIASIMRQ